jgi:hypothetical protein
MSVGDRPISPGSVHRRTTRREECRFNSALLKDQIQIVRRSHSSLQDKAVNCAIEMTSVRNSRKAAIEYLKRESAEWKDRCNKELTKSTTREIGQGAGHADRGVPQDIGVDETERVVRF